MAETARTKIDIMRSCQTPFLSCMLDCMADFYDNQSLGWGGNQGEGVAAVELHRGYTGDIIEGSQEEEEGDDLDNGFEPGDFGRRPGQLSDDAPEPAVQRHRADTLLEEERDMIGSIVGDDREVRTANTRGVGVSRYYILSVLTSHEQTTPLGRS